MKNFLKKIKNKQSDRKKNTITLIINGIKLKVVKKQ